MAKKRTRKQKEKAKHQFTISWRPEPNSASSEPDVKGQKKATSTSKAPKTSKQKDAYLLGNNLQLGTIRHDIIKSLVTASFMLGLEIMIYLFLK
jgi:hypothetical protein